MAMTFGKGNRSIAFNPTSAFPLDARSYFESYEEALKAAKTAQSASSTETQYYYGQDIVVVENNVARFYIIQPDGTLSEVGNKVEIDTGVFEYVDNKLNLFGFSTAVAGAQLTKDSSGKLSWVRPDTTTVEGLGTSLENLQKDLAENYYTKEDTDNAIATAIAATPHLQRIVVASKADINLDAPDADQYIYMIPSGLTQEDNKYNEYIVVISKIVDDEGIETIIKSVELVGSWEVNLEQYATKSDLNDKLDKTTFTEQDIVNVKNINTSAEENFIKRVDAEFNVVDGQLSLVQLSPDKVTGLDDLLANKVSVVQGKGLSTNDFTNAHKEKLDSLNLNDISNMKTSVGNLEKELYGYQDDNGVEIPGLTATIPNIITNINLLSQRADKADGAIVTLNQRADKVDSKITTIEKMFSSLDKTYVSIAQFNSTVGNLDELLKQQHTLVDEINDINTRLTWGSIPDVD